ncbi:Glutathione S-transferase 3 [Sphaceloma murrayae]|uniref:Glutathione S-transferase 3 n=1 Tax=Sphaceloma murrayae TaxID=2082308 RepID=A0A2K1QIU7_9PEZI|nr:Glutathione S-transferase 3 [Sphaceloma murrayae]
MLIVHHLQVSQSDRIVWLCEELGLDYKLQLHQRSPLLSPQSIKDLHPIGAAPIIQDGDITLAETYACAEYIIHKHGGGRLTIPPSDKDYATYLYWYYFANGSLQPGISRLMTATDLNNTSSDSYKRAESRKNDYLGLLDDRLKDNTWLVGDTFTAADIMTVFTLTTMRTIFPYSLAPYPSILSYLKRVVERPGYKKYHEKGDPELPLMIDAEPPKRFTGLKL